MPCSRLKACVLDIETEDLEPLPSGAPSFVSKTPGCRFAPRCPRALDKCALKPPLAETRGRQLACWNPA
jgi:ABC-type dipeptide/oligopeptide/nickel transport system ATPase component